MSRGSLENEQPFILRALSPRALFYDGTCGLCGSAVRFLAWADRHGTLEVLPLGGEVFASRVAAEVRASLPDSLVLLPGDGRLLVRSAAVLEALEGIGGAWRVLARVGRLVPEGLRDRLYDLVARNRGAAAGCRIRR
jgi:predicted DCC family thiol-disulfide oxidoreductase YuxK